MEITTNPTTYSIRLTDSTGQSCMTRRTWDSRTAAEAFRTVYAEKFHAAEVVEVA